MQGEIRRAGFSDHFYEARMGIGFTLPDPVWSVREVDISGAYYFSGPFTGYSFGLSFDF